MNKVKKAEQLFKEGYACSQAVLLAFSEDLGIDEDTAKKISSTFGGGMGRLRKTCGALTGAFMALGLKYGNSCPKDMDSKLNSYNKVQELAKLFEEKYDTTDCITILKNHATKKQVNKREHHRKICDQVVSDTAILLNDMIG